MTHPMNKSARDTTIGNVGYFVNRLIGIGIQYGGTVLFAEGVRELLQGESRITDHPIRDGILIYTAGKLINYGKDTVEYLKELNVNPQ